MRVEACSSADLIRRDRRHGGRRFRISQGRLKAIRHNPFARPWDVVGIELGPTVFVVVGAEPDTRPRTCGGSTSPATPRDEAAPVTGPAAGDGY